MKKVGRILAVVAVGLLLLNFVGCSAMSHSTSDKSVGNAAYNQTANGADKAVTDTTSGGGSTDASLDNASTQRKLIVTSTIEIQTKRFDITISDINNACVIAGGFIESSTVQGKRLGDDEPRIATYAFRVPSDKLDSFKTAVKKTGNVITDNVTSQDVTGDYIDTQGRLTTAMAHRDSLLKFASNTTNVADLIELEKEISTVQTEIESLSTNIQKWDSLVALSTVNVTVDEVDQITVKPVKAKTFWGKVGNSFTSSISFITTVSQGILIVLTWLSPYIVVAAIILFIVFYFRRKGRKQKGGNVS